MTKEQELEKLRNDQAEAKRRARQYENRVKLLLNEANDKERRARTLHLIQHSAILESVFPVKDMDGEKIKALLTQISSLPVVARLLEPYEKNGRRRDPTVHLYTGPGVVRPAGPVASFLRDGASPKPQGPDGPHLDYDTERRRHLWQFSTARFRLSNGVRGGPLWRPPRIGAAGKSTATGTA